jgi:ribosomal-protein-alanine N-acetyltransferase
LIARAQHPVGVISITINGELGDLHRLVVDPRSRRQGIGTDLVRAGLETLRQLGVRAVILDVAYRNEAAIALYQQLGFEQLSARQDYYGPGQHALILKLYDLQSWPDRLASMTEDL